MATLPSITHDHLQDISIRDLQLASQNLTLSKQQYDDIVLDGSGSMTAVWWDMLAAIDGYVDQLKINQTESHIRLSVFTTGEPEYLDIVARNTAIGAWIPLLTDPIGAHFLSTPLYDAINLTGRRLAKLDPARAAVTFVTDGGENGSRTTDLAQARSIIEWMKAKGYQVTFIGCDFNNQRLAQQLGVTPQAAIGVHKAHIADAIRTLADKRAKYGKTGDPMHWTDDEKTEFGGYLNAPANGNGGGN
jgi:hypothetical protein